MNAIWQLIPLALCASAANAGTILTFAITDLNNHQALPGVYGDNVTRANDGPLAYGTDNGVFTPNITVDYGSPGEQPAFWGNGYGNLTNILFNDTDNDTELTITWTAADGFFVTLHSFDLASFVGGVGGLTMQDPAITVADGDGAIPWSRSGPLFVSGAAHEAVAINGGAGVTASRLVLRLNLTGLNGVSDDIGIDNILFSQFPNAPPSSVPEPSSAATLGASLVALLTALRRSARPRRASTAQAGGHRYPARPAGSLPPPQR